MAKTVKTEEEYTADMDRMLTNLKTRKSENEKSRRKVFLIGSSILIVVSAFVIWLMQNVQGGRGFDGIGIF